MSEGAESRFSDHPVGSPEILYRVSPFVSSEDLNALFVVAWEGHEQRNFGPVLRRSLVYICAYRQDRLVGFVNVAWDGGVHAFILDTTVHPDVRRRGVGRGLVVHAAEEAGGRGAEWLHVDFEPHLVEFYRGCGFRATEGGLLNLGPGGS